MDNDIIGIRKAGIAGLYAGTALASLLILAFWFLISRASRDLAADSRNEERTNSMRELKWEGRRGVEISNLRLGDDSEGLIAYCRINGINSPTINKLRSCTSTIGNLENGESIQMVFPIDYSLKGIEYLVFQGGIIQIKCRYPYGDKRISKKCRFIPEDSRIIRKFIYHSYNNEWDIESGTTHCNEISFYSSERLARGMRKILARRPSEIVDHWTWLFRSDIEKGANIGAFYLLKRVEREGITAVTLSIGTGSFEETDGVELRWKGWKAYVSAPSGIRMR